MTGQSTTGASTAGTTTSGGMAGQGGTTRATSATATGSQGTGGTAGSGGALGTGGATGIGGKTGSGGASSAGGATRTDAGPGTGGTTATGGATATDGATATGGNTSTDPSVDARDAISTDGRPSTGGAAGTGAGGSTSTGGTTATGGATGFPNCTVVPVTPNATPQARSALCYLYSITGNHILSGQEENNDDNGMNYIFQNTGKYPAVRAFDVNNSQAPTQCVAHAKKGGLCMFGYHMGIVNGDGYASSQTKTDINTVLTEGSAYNTTFKQRLDKTAAMIQTAQDGGAVAIMRLFHEAGGTWFWWSMETGAQYVRLWKFAFNYLTVTKGLKNMLWLLPYDGSPRAAFYPGKEFVDIGGADTYAGDGNYATQNGMYNNCVKILGSTIPIALHECGPIPEPTSLQSSGIKWILFNVWTSPFYQSPSNSVAHLKAVYSHDYVITLDEMPGF